MTTNGNLHSHIPCDVYITSSRVPLPVCPASAQPLPRHGDSWLFLALHNNTVSQQMGPFRSFWVDTPAVRSPF